MRRGFKEFKGIRETKNRAGGLVWLLFCCHIGEEALFRGKDKAGGEMKKRGEGGFIRRLFRGFLTHAEYVLYHRLSEDKNFFIFFEKIPLPLKKGRLC